MAKSSQMKRENLFLLASHFIFLYPMICRDAYRTPALSLTMAYLPTTVSAYVSLFNRWFQIGHIPTRRREQVVHVPEQSDNFSLCIK